MLPHQRQHGLHARRLVCGLVLAAALVVLPLAGCARRSGVAGGGAPRPSRAHHAPSAPHAPSVRGAVYVADIPAPLDALAATGTTLFAVSKERGQVYALELASADHAPSLRVLSSAEREPFAVVARDGMAIWASADGVFTFDEARAQRRALIEGRPVRALAVGAGGVYFATHDALWRGDWPRSSVVTELAREVNVDELVALDRWLVGRGGRTLFRVDLATGARSELPSTDQRKPHDLSTDGRLVLWHEGEADLLPGREPSAFVADSSASWQARRLEGTFDSSDSLLLRAGIVYGQAKCAPVRSGAWRRFDSHDRQTAIGVSPVTDDARSWYWVEGVCGDGGCGESSRLFSVAKAACVR